MKKWGWSVLIFAVLGGWLISANDLLVERVKIYDGHQSQNALSYQQEFADTISISTHWHDGRPMQEPDFSLKEQLNSPDGQSSLVWNQKDYFHRLAVIGKGAQGSTTIVNAEEGDPGSGRAYTGAWSKDSKAVFVYGEGRLPGTKSNRLSFIYLVAEKRLYQVDIENDLKKRATALSQMPH